MFHKDNGLSEDLLVGCKVVLRERKVVLGLMSKCESISSKMVKQVTMVMERGTASMKQPHVLNSQWVKVKYWFQSAIFYTCSEFGWLELFSVGCVISGSLRKLSLFFQVPTEALSADWSKVAAASTRTQTQWHPGWWDGEATCDLRCRLLLIFKLRTTNVAYKLNIIKLEIKLPLGRIRKDTVQHWWVI